MARGFDFGPFFAAARARQQAALEAARQAVDQFGEQLIGNAQEMTPVETGALAASGTAADAAVEGTKVVKLVGFNTDYAAARHERPPTTDAPPKINPKGRWKFLEEAMRQLRGKFDSFVGRRVRDAVEG